MGNDLIIPLGLKNNNNKGSSSMKVHNINATIPPGQKLQNPLLHVPVMEPG